MCNPWQCLLVPLMAVNCFAQGRAGYTICPTVTGVYPVDFTSSAPLNEKARFEIRLCGNSDIQLLGFRTQAKAPSMIEVGGEVVGIIQRGTWIVLQLAAGSSTPTLVAQFRDGEPVLLERVDGDDGINYRQGGEFDVITIPLKNPPIGFPQRKPKVFRLKN